MGNGMIEPMIEGFIPESTTKSSLKVRDASAVSRRVFDSDGELYFPDGTKVLARMELVEAAIPALDDTRIVALETAKTQNDIDIASIQGDIGSLQSDVVAAQGEITTLQGDVLQLKTDVTNNAQDVVKEIVVNADDTMTITYGSGVTKTTESIKGDPGSAGTDGTSAYASAVAGGYAGTESDFQTDLASISGLAAAIDAIVGV